MKKVLKYPITGYGVTTIEVPGTGKVLCCDTDPVGDICVWIQVSTKAGESSTSIVIHSIFTGDEFLGSNLAYINSLKTGTLMIHCFQEK